MKKTLFAILMLLAASNLKATPLMDISIIMDASGSVGSVGWQMQKLYVSDLIENQLQDYASISIIRFASGASVEYSFGDNQDRAAIANTVDNLSYPGGFTHTKTAIETSLTEFNAFSSPNTDRFLLLITDGNPNPSSSQSPCSRKNNLDSEAVGVFILGVGSQWNPDTIDCLVDDPSTQIANVFDFGDINSGTGGFLGHIETTIGTRYADQSSCAAASYTWSTANGGVCTSAALVSSVPEPTGLLLLSSALLGLGIRRRTKTNLSS